MFLSTRGLAPFKEKEKCLHNTQATLAKKTFSTWRPTVTLTPAQPAARPAPPLTTTKGATATFATTKVASFTGFGQTGQPGGSTAGGKLPARPPPKNPLTRGFWRGRASSSSTTTYLGVT
jgi:hypothetical protein